jgi:hypothetical protein
VLSICTAPRDEHRFPGLPDGLLTIRPYTRWLAKKGTRIVHPWGPLGPELRLEGSKPSNCPSIDEGTDFTNDEAIFRLQSLASGKRYQGAWGAFLFLPSRGVRTQVHPTCKLCR